MKATWNLKEMPPTFDYASWLVAVKTLGATTIHFKDEGEIQKKKFPEEVAWERFRTILVGLTELSGTPYTRGPGGNDGITTEYHPSTVEALYRRLGRVWKFPLIDGPRDGYITVTLRNSKRYPERNSSPAWDEFIRASKRRVVVLADNEANPMPFPERMKLYSNAEMNYGVNNGPMWFCQYSDAPYRVFNYAPSKAWKAHYERIKFPPGSQFSFRTESQEICWKPDTLETIMARIDDK